MRDERAEVLTHLTTLAEQHLSVSDAEEWLGLLRPAVWLAQAGDGDPVVATQGGLAPIDVSRWPEVNGYRVPHLMTLDCAQLQAAAETVGVLLSDVGTLSFFHWNFHADPLEQKYPPFELEAQGRRFVVHQPPPVLTTGTAPSGLVVAYPEVPLTAVLTLTIPPTESLRLHELQDPDGDGRLSDALAFDEVWSRNPRIGGHPATVQAAVEFVADGIRYGSPSRERARGWSLLLQVTPDSDHDMPLGDETVFYLREDGDGPEDCITISQGT